jgi:serine/threonine protein kinase
MKNQGFTTINSEITVDVELYSTRTANLSKATNSQTGESVYLWTLRHAFSERTDSEIRFINRISKIIQLTSGNDIFTDYGIDENGVAFAIISPIRGAIINPKMFFGKEAERIAFRCIKYIADIHNAGLVCGDISPGSFWLDLNGEVRFIGVMGSFDVEANSTSVMPPLETYNYLSPEQRNGEALEPTTDVYALGVLLYFIFTGKYPAIDEKQVLMGCPSPEKIISISKLNNKAPKWCELIIPRCLTTQSSSRYSSVAELYENIILFIKNQNNTELGSKYDNNEKVNLDNQPFVDSHAPVSSTNSIISNYFFRKKIIYVGTATLVTLVCLLSIFVSIPTIKIFLGLSNNVKILQGIYDDEQYPEDIKALRRLLLNAKSDEELEKILIKLGQNKHKFSYRLLLDVTDKLKRAHMETARTAEEALLNKLRERYSSFLVYNLSEILKTNVFSECYISALSAFDESYTQEQRINEVRTAYTIAANGIIKLVGLLALETKADRVWEDVLNDFVGDSLKLTDTDKRSTESLLLLHPQIISFLSKKRMVILFEKLSSADKAWLLRVLPYSQGDVFALIAQSLIDDKSLFAPKRIFFEPLSASEPMPIEVREVLVKAGEGNYDLESVNIIYNWYNHSSPKILLAMCADTSEELIREKAFKAIISRGTDISPSSQLINWLKDKEWEREEDLRKNICKLAFYDSLSTKEQEQLIIDLEKFINASGFVTTLISAKDNKLIIDILNKYGKDLGLANLLVLLDYPSSEIKIKSIEYLKWYKDLGLFRQITKKFETEQDPKVKEAYRKNFWVINQK